MPHPRRARADVAAGRSCSDSRAVHRHALIARDEADVLSPGTGMQQRASLTHTSFTPLTDTPRELVFFLAFSTARSGSASCSTSSSTSSLPASLTRCAMTFCVEICRRDRREHGVGVGEIQLVGDADQRLGGQ